MLQKKRSLADLQNPSEFVARHIGPDQQQQQAMLLILVN